MTSFCARTDDAPMHNSPAAASRISGDNVDMKRVLLLAALLCSLSSIAGAQDMEKGNEAYKILRYETELPKWRMLAERGDVRAQFAIGDLYAWGLGVPKDAAEAMRWFRKSADQGNAYAQYLLANKYAEGGLVLPQDYAEAMKWYHKSAEQGYAQAQYRLGVIHDTGDGVPQDHAEALKWYRRAVEQGFAKAQYNLAVIYDKGLGVPQDHAEAYIWYSLAATGGFKDASRSRDELAAKLMPEQLRAAQREARRRWDRIQARKK